MKKLISTILACAVVCVPMTLLSGCGDKNYPVEIANFKIDSEPQHIVVLDDSAADIISYLGYDVKMVGRSEEVDQKMVAVAPVVGTKNEPDVSKIKEYEADLVFAGPSLDDRVEYNLESDGINVVSLSVAETPKQLETNYSTVGKILGGKIDGANKAAKAYSKLIDTMEKMKNEVTIAQGSDAPATVCYLYFENENLKLLNNGSYGDMLLDYTGAVNVAENIDEKNVDVNTIKLANPDFLFYSDNYALEAIKGDHVLSQLDAVKSGRTMQISDAEMSRQGYTAINTLQRMINFMYPNLAKPIDTPDSAQSAAQSATKAAVNSNTQSATKAAVNSNTQSATKAAVANNNAQADSSSVSTDYKINLEKLSLKIEDENGNVKIMQKRLYDLGYITDSDNVTGYYGEISEQAVKDFQKNNKIKVTGTADNATLKAMFSANAVKA